MSKTLLYTSASPTRTRERNLMIRFWPLAALVLVFTVQLTFHNFTLIRKRNNIIREDLKTEIRAGSASIASDKGGDKDGFVDQCSIYLAPSSVTGNPGLGLYTTRDIRKGENVLRARDSISIPIFDLERGPASTMRYQWFNLFKKYFWAKGVPAHSRFEARFVVDFQTAFGSLPNHHCLLGNVAPVYPALPYNDNLLNRFEDSGAGAISYDHGRVFQAKKHIEANDELFMNYGYCNRTKNYDTDHVWTDLMPMSDDFKQAASIIWKFLNQRNGTIIPIPHNANKHVRSLLPETIADLPMFMIENTTHFTEKDVREWLARNVAATPRNEKWIRQNGMCLENLVPIRSKLSQAGEGAAAQFHLAKGKIIAPAMMLHIVDKDSLFEYDVNGIRVGTQLLLNYCMGHAESSLLLCPHSNVVLVNHCSMRTKECGPEGPNAAYRWSTGWDSPTSDIWRNKSLEELGEESSRVLSMELVALRDIQPGEEVYVDYGTEWERAWEKHVGRWRPPQPPLQESWITAKEANDNIGPIMDAFITDLHVLPMHVHPHLFTGCSYQISQQDTQDNYSEEGVEWEQMKDADILKRFADDGSSYGKLRKSIDYAIHSDKSFWPCSVLHENKKNATYTVRIHQSSSHKRQIWDINEMPRILTNYPRKAIHYFVKPYESDQHLRTAFRFPMGIPPEIFPSQWKNRKVY